MTSSSRRAPWAVGLLAALPIITALAWLSSANTRRLVDQAALTQHTHVVLETIASAERALIQAESARRGYVLSGAPEHVTRFHDGEHEVHLAMARLAELTSDNPGQQGRLLALTPLIERRLGALELALARTGFEPDQAARQAEIVEEGTERMAEIRAAFAAITSVELRLLDERQTASAESARSSELTVVFGSFLSLLLVLTAVLQLSFEHTRRSAAERALAEKVAELEVRSGHMERLAELGGFLQAAETCGEVYGILAELGPPLLPGCSGQLFVFDPAADRFARRAAWGTRATVTDPFEKPDCWALRTQRLMHHAPGGLELACAHAAGDPRESLCIPLLARGETLGLIHLTVDAAPHAGGRISPALRQLAITVGDKIALALANARLHEEAQILSPARWGAATGASSSADHRSC